LRVTSLNRQTAKVLAVFVVFVEGLDLEVDFDFRFKTRESDRLELIVSFRRLKGARS
jgi:hypothetical protein